MCDFLTALALVLIIEGIVPALLPHRWKESMRFAVAQKDIVIRRVGLVAMLLGAFLLYLMRG